MNPAARVSATPFTLLGLSLSIFMSFRNNACYDRWWEGRKAWGQVVVEMRSFIRESVAITDAALRERLLRALCGYAHALNARLRNEDELQAQARRNALGEWRYVTLEQRLVGLSEAQAVCERIKSTPLPFPYTLLLHRTIYIFCILLPFAMAEPLGWMAPIFTTIVSYTFFGLDALGDQIADPFDTQPNDLPLDAMSRHLEIAVMEILGESELPAPLEPVDGLLL